MNRFGPSQHLPVVVGGWKTIVADPPWWFDDRGSRATPAYPFMKTEAICALPVIQVVADEAHLYLWAPDSHILSGEATEVARAWGFNPVCFIHWFKREKAYIPGGRPGRIQIGMGHYVRHATETVVFCERGKCKPNVHNIVNLFEAGEVDDPEDTWPLIQEPRGRHSKKPEKLQDIAEALSPGPYLEMFARRTRENWTCWGNEIAA